MIARLLTPIALLALAAPAAAQDEPERHAEGERELAALLDGRTPGEAQPCMRLFPSRNFEIIERTAIVYKQGGTVWVNRPRNPDVLDEDDGIATRPLGNRLCSYTNVTTFQRQTGVYRGNLFLGDFVPWRRVDAD